MQGKHSYLFWVQHYCLLGRVPLDTFLVAIAGVDVQMAVYCCWKPSSPIFILIVTSKNGPEDCIASSFRFQCFICLHVHRCIDR